ncbi:MAG: DMT family transporter [Candidatus Nanopelagicaceae bacterium]
MTSRLKPLAPLALVLVAAMWGLAFVLMVDPIERQGINDFLSFRFLFATLFLILIRPRVIGSLSLPLITKGGVAGTFLGLGYIFQTLGLSLTTPAITGFITGLYVVITPIFSIFFLRSKIATIGWIAVMLATSGLLVLSFNGLEVSWGAIAVFISAVFFAAHIITLGAWSKEFDTYSLTTMQLATCALITTVAAIPGGVRGPVGSNGWFVVLFTALFATVLAFIVQTWAQSIISTTTVAVLLTTEVLFAAIFSVATGTESLTTRLVLGGVLVTAGMYLILLTDRSTAEPREKERS